MKKLSILLSMLFIVFIASGAFAQKPGNGRDEPKSDKSVKTPKEKPVVSDTESPVKGPKDKPMTGDTDSPVKPPKDKPVLDKEPPVKPPKAEPATETDSPVKPPKDNPVMPAPKPETIETPIKGKGPSQETIQKAEQNSGGNAFSGKGKGGDKNLIDPDKKTKKLKKNKKAKKDSGAESGTYNPPPRPIKDKQ